jgi:hypothetical protein
MDSANLYPCSSVVAKRLHPVSISIRTEWVCDTWYNFRYLLKHLRLPLCPLDSY